MKRSPKLMAAGALATAALVGGVPVAGAAKGGGQHQAIKRLVIKTSASYLGLTRKELRTQLHGKSLAQLAVGEGKTVDGLVQAIYDAAKAKLDKRVAAGKLTAQKEQAKLTKLQAKILKLVNKVRT